jgi:(p)ppGpp synthase/HD superfamily hydrolase
MEDKIKWCIDKHNETNHMYDEYLNYEFHLRMVVQVFKKFKYLVHEKDLNDVELACWGHDLIEDCRVSYNDAKNQLGEISADIIYSVTNEKGKNRKERANDKYYQGIRDTKYAVFVKLCDRIANVQYSKMTGSRMYEMYKEENENFITNMGYYENYNKHEFLPLFRYLDNLFNG